MCCAYPELVILDQMALICSLYLVLNSLPVCLCIFYCSHGISSDKCHFCQIYLELISAVFDDYKWYWLFSSISVFFNKLEIYLFCFPNYDQFSTHRSQYNKYSTARHTNTSKFNTSFTFLIF
jgi:hypothetical protein